MMNINKDAVRKRIMDIRHDISTIMSSIEINYDDNNDTVWCAKVIKNIAHLVSLSSMLLIKLEMEKYGLMAVIQKHMKDLKKSELELNKISEIVENTLTELNVEGDEI